MRDGAEAYERVPSVRPFALAGPTDLYGGETPAVIACHAISARYRAAARANTMRVSISHGVSPCHPRTIMTKDHCAE